MADYLCIHHARCADGFGSAWVVRRWFQGAAEPGDTLEFHPGVYTEAPPDATGKDVLLVDFSYNAETVRELALKAKSVTILDHHKTAIEALQPLLADGLIQGAFALDKSGVGVTWDWFFGPEPMPRLLQHVQDRDLWKFALPGTGEISAWLFSFPYDFDVWDALVEELDTEGDTAARLQGRAIARKHSKDIQELLDIMAREAEIDGVTVPVANLPYTMSSEAGHEMAKGLSTFAACYYDLPTERCFSLRSDENGMDVGAIARKYGGGGHVRAAGFSVPRDHQLARF